MVLRLSAGGALLIASVVLARFAALVVSDVTSLALLAFAMCLALAGVAVLLGK